MTLSRLRPRILLAVASLAPFAAAYATPAAADFFFRPFGYAFHRPMPEPAPYVSPRAIAEILEEEGFRLVGALGRRGDQLVATGVDRRGRYRRFLIDPFEGEILRSWRLGPEAVHEAPGALDAPPAAYGAPPGPEPYEASRTDPLVVPGLGAEPRRPAPRSAAPSRRADEPRRAHAAARPEGAETQRAPHVQPSRATKPPARPTPTRSAAPHGSDRPAAPQPAAMTPADREAPAPQQSGATPSPAAAPAPTPPIESKAPHATPVPEPAAVGHQQAAPAPQTIVPATPPPPAAASANPVSAEQSKAPPSGEPPKPAPGG